MISPTSLAFPGGRTLAGWWRQLTPHQPTALWVGYLFVHRLEALAELTSLAPLEPVQRLLLEALRLPNNDLPLAQRLHLNPAFLQKLLADLARDQLVAAQTEPTLTEAGRQALVEGRYARPTWERRVFSFAENLTPAGQRSSPPHFLTLRGHDGVPWQPGTTEGFDPAWLHACVRQPAAWKQQFHFPAEVQSICDLASPGSSPPAWQRVVVDRPERSLLAFTSTESQQLLAFGVRPDGWQLHSQEPVLNLEGEARSVLPDLQVLASESWRSAWLDWCKARNQPLEEARRCELHRDGVTLTVRAPEPLHRRLQLGKSDIFKGEAWLLGGDGYLRAAVRLHMVPS